MGRFQFTTEETGPKINKTNLIDNLLSTRLGLSGYI